MAPDTPAALKVMDAGENLADVAVGWVRAALRCCRCSGLAALLHPSSHTILALDAKVFSRSACCGLPSAGDVNAFLKEASMMQRLVDCPQVGGAWRWLWCNLHALRSHQRNRGAALRCSE